uniref:Uncharacterized protein n=1 Tax=Arundo donax TaxID=35708 RepID=A0A0A8YQF0_ARUDO
MRRHTALVVFSLIYRPKYIQRDNTQPTHTAKTHSILLNSRRVLTNH